MPSPRYDYVFAGTGAAAFSLLMRLLKEGQLDGKKVLLVDREAKTRNDRTWCFWERGEGFFEQIVHKQWPALQFADPSGSFNLDIGRYRYKMIRGIDFYRHCLSALQQHPSIEFLQGEASFSKSRDKAPQMQVNGQTIPLEGSTVFSSLYEPETITPRNISLLQHFKGWWIETDQPAFNADRATLMDFSVSQHHGTSFAYVLPVSPTRALVEYTLFTKYVLDERDYESQLKSYIENHLRIGSYRIQEKEFGVIPMSVRKFLFRESGIYHIGTAGGQTKASTGYTFQFIQKRTAAIARAIASGHSLDRLPQESRRFHFYDSVLLRLLVRGDLQGREIFSRLFHRNPAHRIFRFLDNESNLMEEMQLISTLQPLPFLRSAIAGWLGQ